MRNVSLNTKKYKLPSHLNIPTTTPFPSKVVRRKIFGASSKNPSMFRPIPDQSPKSKALLAVPSTKVEEKIVTDYTKQAKAADKSHLDGVKMNEALIFDTLEKIKPKKKLAKKRKITKKVKKQPTKKKKKNPQTNFSISS